MSGRNVKDYRNEAKEISEEGTGGIRLRKGAFCLGVLKINRRGDALYVRYAQDLVYDAGEPHPHRMQCGACDEER